MSLKETHLCKVLLKDIISIQQISILDLGIFWLRKLFKRIVKKVQKNPQEIVNGMAWIWGRIGFKRVTFSGRMALTEKEEEDGLLEGKGLRGEAERPLGEYLEVVVVVEVKLLFSWLAIGEAVAILLLLVWLLWSQGCSQLWEALIERNEEKSSGHG